MYKCSRCLKKFPIKSRLLRHFNGKKICNLAVGGEDLSKNELLAKLKKMEEEKKPEEKPKKKIKKNFKCEKCGEFLFTEHSLLKHSEFCYGPDVCIWKTPLKFGPRSNLTKFKLYKYVLYYIKHSFLTPRKLIRKISNYYLVYEEGKWKKLLKFQLMQGILNTIGKRSKILNHFHKKFLTDMADFITDQHKLKQWETIPDISALRCLRYVYRFIFDGLNEGLDNVKSILDYEEEAEALKNELAEAIKNELAEAEQEIKKKNLERWKDETMPQILDYISDFLESPNEKHNQMAIEELSEMNIDHVKIIIDELVDKGFKLEDILDPLQNLNPHILNYF